MGARGGSGGGTRAAALWLACLGLAVCAAGLEARGGWQSTRPMHDMWGREDDGGLDPAGFDGQAAGRAVATQEEAKRAFGIEEGSLLSETERDLGALAADGEREVVSLWRGRAAGGGQAAAAGKASKAAQQKHRIHRAHMEAAALPDRAEPARGRAIDTQTLSKINQPEMGHLSKNQSCPSFGLDQLSFLVVGQARHLWRKAVEIRSADGEVLGTVKRGCPAWTNSFAWKVPEEQASGCRSGVDPNVFGAEQCQIPETEILYTDQWSGLVSSSSIRVMDCHDDLLFKIYEVKRDVVLAGYMIHSDFVAEDVNGNIMGYCKLEGFEDSLAEVGQKNYSFVDLEGNEIARAERPLHWDNGATEHIWNVSVLVPSVPGTLSDTRVILVAVANNVLLHEESDWCSNIVFTITPVILTLTAIGCIAGLSAVYSYIKSPPTYTPPSTPLAVHKLSPEILSQIRPIREI